MKRAPVKRFDREREKRKRGRGRRRERERDGELWVAGRRRKASKGIHR